MVKIRVYEADGKWRGGLFEDHMLHGDRWIGAPKPNLREEMVRQDSGHQSTWFLIEYLIPREITGRDENDSSFDERSKCCCQTPPQALQWFAQQTFGPPPDLVDQVRSLARDWRDFLRSAGTQDLLSALIAKGNLNDDDPLLTRSGPEALELLRRVGVAHEGSSGGSRFFFADSVAQDMGVERYIKWMDRHLKSVSHEISTGANAEPAAEAGPSLLSQASALVERAVEVARFAARLSADWVCKSGRPPIELEARMRLRDRSPEAAAELRAAATALIATDQAVTATHRLSDAEYAAITARRDKAKQSVELLAKAAPATAAELLADAMATMEREREKDPSYSTNDAWVRARKAAIVLEQVVRPLIAAAENELAAEWLQQHGGKLQRAVDDFALALAPHTDALARMAPDGGRKLGRWAAASWSDALVALVRDLIAAVKQRDMQVPGAALDELQTEKLLIDLKIEMARVTQTALPTVSKENDTPPEGQGLSAGRPAVPIAAEGTPFARLRNAVHRLGLVGSDDVDAAAQELAQALAEALPRALKTWPDTELLMPLQQMQSHLAELRYHSDWKRTMQLLVVVQHLLPELIDRTRIDETAARSQSETPDPSSWNADPKCCVVARQRPDRATVTEGGTTVTIKGPRRVWLLLAVADAAKALSWDELVQADVNAAGVVLDRRIRSRSAAGTEAPRNSSGSIPRGVSTPRMATQAKTLQNLGTRIRKDLGKLGYHWEQDGHGVVWNSDCQ
ncbi:MAG: hypothetical protein U1E73_05200 [Planctomycetota bacterium]